MAKLLPTRIAVQLRSGDVVWGRPLDAEPGTLRIDTESGPVDVPESDVLQRVESELPPRGIVAPGLAPATSGPLHLETRPATPAALHEELLATSDLKTYALIDGARAGELYERLDQVPGATCLYSGELDAERARVAPWLLPLAREGALLPWLAKGWGESWGLYLQSRVGPAALAAHLRGFLQAVDPLGESLVFRFYDPRVLRVYLPTLNAREAGALFGGLRCLRPDGAQALECPLCGRPVDARCPPCALPASGEAPFLVEALVLEAGAPESALRVRPSAEAPPLRVADDRRRLHPIRADQLAAFAADYHYRARRELLCAHVQATFPEQCAAIGAEEVRGSVRRGVLQGIAYGLRGDYELSRFLNVLFLTDRSFWRRPWAFGWLKTLESPALSQLEKVDWLWIQALAHVKSPPADAPPRPWSDPTPAEVDDAVVGEPDDPAAHAERERFLDWAYEHLRRVCPKRCQTMSDDALRSTIASGYERARWAGLVADADVAKFLDVMFLWDLEFDRHAEGPWQEILADRSLDSGRKAARLWGTARGLLEGLRERTKGAS